MRTLFICSQFPCYDETFILREMNALRDAGLDIRVFSLKHARDAIVHGEAKALAEKTEYLPFLLSPEILLSFFHFLFSNPLGIATVFSRMIFETLKSPGMLARSLALLPKTLAMARRLNKNPVDFIHAQWATHPATAAIIIQKLTGIPWGFTGHAHDIYVNTTRLPQKIRDASYISTCTAHNKDYLLGLVGEKIPAPNSGTGKKILVSYHGLDTTKYFPARELMGEKRFHIVSVGSLLECKGYEYLIEACRLLQERQFDFECVIVGGGPLESALRAQIEKAGLREKIKLVGYTKQEDMPKYYQQADLFVLPAVLQIHWGIPNVLIEAAACGLPFLVTELPSVKEILKDGDIGRFIPEKNPKAMADEIQKLASLPDHLREMGALGRARIEDMFDLAQNARKLKSHMEHYVGGKA